MAQYSTTVRNNQNDCIEFGAIQGCPTSTAAWAALASVTAKTSWCINGGHVYLCTTTGTTASSGGPTGTGSDITDGSAHWTYVGEASIEFTPLLRMYAGAMPANCAASATGTKVVDDTLPAGWAGASSGGVKSLAGSWQSNAVAGGLAAYYRFYDPTGTTCHIQGLVSQAWTATFAYLLNQQVHLGGNVYKCTTAGTSAGSGGPTGTGSGITDGSAVWAYVGAQEMTLDNTNLANAQQVTVNTYAITRGNA